MPRSNKGAKADVNDVSMEELDALLKEHIAVAAEDDTTPSSGNVVVNFLMATAVSALPIYLYTSPMFDLTFEEHAVYFGVVTLVAAVFLTLAYSKTAEKEVRRLAALAKRRGGKKKGEEGANTGSSITTQAVSWAMFYNNLLFLILFVVLAFNIVPAAVPGFINYIVAVAGPGVVVHMLS